MFIVDFVVGCDCLSSHIFPREAHIPGKTDFTQSLATENKRKYDRVRMRARREREREREGEREMVQGMNKE